MPIFREGYFVCGCPESFGQKLIAIITDIVHKNGLEICHDLAEIHEPNFGGIRLPKKGVKIPPGGNLKEQGLAILAQLLATPSDEDKENPFRIYGIIPGSVNLQLVVTGMFTLISERNAQASRPMTVGEWEMWVSFVSHEDRRGDNREWKSKHFPRSPILEHSPLDAALRFLSNRCANIRKAHNLRPVSETGYVEAPSFSGAPGPGPGDPIASSVVRNNPYMDD